MIAAAWVHCSELGCPNGQPIDERRAAAAPGWLCPDHEDEA